MTIRINDRRLWVSLVAIVSAMALVALAVDSDNDGMSDAYETLFSLSSTNPADAILDSDGDGVTNLQESVLPIKLPPDAIGELNLIKTAFISTL